jgi:uncharacterized protein (TIGR02145 family)/uncharacterized repeat protein (TIGR02543 family)
LGELELPPPTRTGYEFDGWYTTATGGTKYEDSYAVTGDITLYAQWKINEYTVTLDANGGEVTQTSFSATHGQTLGELSLPTPTRTGYGFDGWFSAATGGTKYADTYAVTGDVTLYAQWKINGYTVTLNANSGSVTPTSRSATHGQTLTQLSLPTPTRTGYGFDGWYTAATGGEKYANDYAVTGNITLYAHWKINEYTVTLNANDGTVTPTSLTAVHGQTLGELSLPTPTRTGYDFDGWFSAATGGTKRENSYAVTGNVTLYAQWKRYTVTLNANSGSVTPNIVYATHGQTLAQLSLPTPTRTGYGFDGWYTTATGGTKYDDTHAVTGNITLYARWLPTYIVTYNINGGSGTAPDKDTVNAGSNVTLASGSGLTRTGYTFGGWNSNSSGSGTNYSAGSSYTPSGNITLYARWTCTVTYDINDGSGTAPAAQTVNAGSGVTLAGGSGLTRTGYTFGGWNTNNSGTGTNYNAGSSYTPAGDITLYAKWTPPFNPDIPYGSFTDSRDGKSYRTVEIGTQTWMAENLNYEPSSGNSWCYGNSADSCTKYGRLYDWNTAMGGASSSAANPSGVQGVCPSGWHLPSSSEWNDLMTAVGGSSTAGKKLKSQTGWNLGDNGTDEYGFSALPGGYRYSGSFSSAGTAGIWRSTTEAGNGNVNIPYMGYNNDVVEYNNYKDSGYSVRCLMGDAHP